MNNNKHIALFFPSLEGGGAQRVMLNLAQGFIDLDHKVDLILTQVKGPYLNEVPSKSQIVDLKVKRVMYSLPGLINYLKKERPNILFSTLDNANIVAISAKLIARVPTIIVVREANTLSMHSRKGWKCKLFRLLIRLLYPLSNKVVAVSNGVGEDLIKSIKIPKDKIKVIYNPVVIPETEVNSTEVFVHKWYRLGEPPVILGVGSLERQKDFETLIRAFNLVRKSINCRLIILGEGSQRGRLESLIRELDLIPYVLLPGFVNNPFAYMKKSSVFVLSSAWEGLPNVLLQAIACGCPVVSTDCPSGPVEILQNGKYGKLVPVGSAETMASEIMNTIKNDYDPNILRARALDFSLKKITEQYLSLL